MKDINIILFGGFGLIGFKLYKHLLQQSHNVIIADFKKNKNFKGDFYKLNAEKEKDISVFLKKIEKKLNQIDVVINCTYPKNAKKNLNFFKESKKNFLNKINSQIGIAFSINKIFIQYFKKKKIEGNIIHFSSIYGSFIPRFEIYKNLNFNMPLDYMISKSSINYLTKYLSKLLLGHKIRINNISPGGIFDFQRPNFVRKYSKFTNHKSLLNPEDIFGVIDFLVNPKNKKITGQNIIIDDGFTL